MPGKHALPRNHGRYALSNGDLVAAMKCRSSDFTVSSPRLSVRTAGENARLHVGSTARSRLDDKYAEGITKIQLTTEVTLVRTPTRILPTVA